MRTNGTGLRWLWVAVLVLVLDRLTKILAMQKLTVGMPFFLMPGFNITLQYNTGAAFSLLSQASGWQSWLFGSIAVVISVGLLIWLRRLSVKQWWVAIALTLIVGGALGNLWDRLSYGHVIDFIDWYVSVWHWPVFNIADSAICIGAAMLFIDALRHRKK